MDDNPKERQKHDVYLFQQMCEKFKNHVERFEQHELDEIKKFDRLIDAQQKNTAAISELTQSVSKIIESTSAVIRLHKDFQGAARVGKGFQNFMMWLLRWGAIGTGVVSIMVWSINRLNSTV